MLHLRKSLEMPAQSNHIDEFAGAVLDVAFDKGMAWLWLVDGVMRVFGNPVNQCKINGRPLRRLIELGRAEFLGQYDCYANGIDIIEDINFNIWFKQLN